MKTLRRGTGIFIGALLLLAFSAAAQPLQNEVRITRIDTTGYPTIRIHLRVLCNGVPTSSINPVELGVKDGDINKTFTLSCPTETQPVSVALVCDRSGSVAGTSILMIKQGAKEFVSLFGVHPSGTDEGALISFSDTMTLDQPMTRDKQALFNAINALYPLGYTSMFDAAKLAVQHVADSAHNPIRAVVLLSDGYDNMSWASRTEVIWLARNNHVPIYTIGTSYEDSSYGAQNMRILADSTGGMYFPVYEPAQIVEAFNAIASMLTGGGNDCVAEYQTECADGTLRTVTVTANACGIAVTRTQSYRAKLDPALPKFTLRAGAAIAYTDSRVRVPILIRAESPGADVKEIKFRIPLTPLLTDAQWITAPCFAGRLTTNCYATNAAAWFSAAGSQFLMGEDTLCYLDVAAGTVQKDSLLPLTLLDVVRKIDGCLIPIFQNGSILLRVRPVLGILCTDSIAVRYDFNAGNYLPDTIALTVTTRNSGTVIARNVSARVILPSGMQSVDGITQRLLTPSILGTNQSASGTFLLRAAPSDSARLLPICIETFSDSSQVSRCCTKISIAGARPKLEVLCSAPKEVLWDDAKREFVPNPFTVSMRIVNRSVLTAQNVTAWIHLPPEFDLDPSTSTIQSVAPSILARNDSGTVLWLVRALERPTSDTVPICLKVAAGGDTAVCCLPIFVTASPVRITMNCTAPTAVAFDERTQEYTPGQFLVATSILNTSLLPMSHVQAQLTLSGTYGLANGESAVKFPPGQLLQSGDSATFAWRVAAVRTPEGDSALACVRITADNFPGTQCCRLIRLQRLNSAPVLSCAIDGPDTVRFVDRSYVPNPVTLGLTVNNTGTFYAKNVTAALLQGSDISIDSNDVALKQIADSLAGGGSVQTTFRLRVLPRAAARYDTVRITVYAQNGGSAVCEKILWIDAVRNPILSLQCSAPDSILFSDSLASYAPAPFPLTVTVRNTGGVDATNVTAEFLSATGLSLAAGEQAVKAVQPALLGPGGSGQVSWLVMPNPHTISSVDTMRVRITADGGFSGTIAGCAATTAVQAFRAPQLKLQCAIPIQPAIVQNVYQPNPLAVEATVTNSGAADGFILKAELLNGAGYAIAPPDSAPRLIPRLSVGGAQQLRWMIRIFPSQKADTQLVCIRLTDRAGGFTDCCAKLFIPALGIPDLRISCAPPDTLWPDPATGEYQNPFFASATVTNPSTVTLDTVKITPLLPTGISFDTGENAEKVLLSLAPQGIRQASWKLRAAADTGDQPRIRIIRFEATSSAGAVECAHTLVLMPRLDIRFTISCAAPDSIRYAGPATGLRPDPFPVSVSIRNGGAAILASAGATIQLPSELTLVAGEQATKYLSQPLAPGGSGIIAWNVHPSLQATDKLVTCIITAQNAPAPAQDCAARIWIEGIKEEIQLRIPVGNLVRVGQTAAVPVYITQESPVLLPSIDFTVGFDGRLVTVEGTQQAGTLTESWDKIRLSDAGAGRIRLHAEGALPIQANGALCQLIIRAISADGTGNPFATGRSPLNLVDPAVRSGVRVAAVDGDITVSGTCLAPLLAGERFVLHQNRPNPFNPRTEIQFEIPSEMDGEVVTLEVYDVFQRRIATFIDGPASRGLHTVAFDGSNYPSGMYFYALEWRGGMVSRRMLLAK